jgi:hypothetical protein
MMMLAMQPPNALSHHHELRRYLLNRTSLQLPSEYKVYLYYFAVGQFRFESGTAVLDINNGGGSLVLAEVTIPPFGYFVTSTNNELKANPKLNELCDITWFNQYQYNVWTRLHLQIPSKETHFPTPLDYRTFEDMQKESKEEMERQ